MQYLYEPLTVICLSQITSKYKCNKEAEVD